MEHSIEAYLARQSTEVLEGLLRSYCASEKSLCSNEDSVRLILKELKRRYEIPGGRLPPHVRKAWEEYLLHMEKRHIRAR